MLSHFNALAAICAAALAARSCLATQSMIERRSLVEPKVRLVDASGSFGSVGLLQVRSDNANAVEFGTVCGMNLAAADIVCAQLGYDFGTVSTSPCGSYGGADLCGSHGSHVAMANLACEGRELDIQECSFSEPNTTCLEHAHDSVVFCGSDRVAGGFSDGAERLLSYDGSPSIDGFGRLEVFHGGVWTPVCTSGFTAGAATVACKAMGFSGVDRSTDGTGCKDTRGNFFCGSAAPRVSEVACSGQETDLMACSYEDSDDVFCAPEESVVLHCTGHGDTQGRPRKAHAPQTIGAA